MVRNEQAVTLLATTTDVDSDKRRNRYALYTTRPYADGTKLLIDNSSMPQNQKEHLRLGINCAAELLKQMLNQVKDILFWCDNMRKYVPLWYR